MGYRQLPTPIGPLGLDPGVIHHTAEAPLDEDLVAALKAPWPTSPLEAGHVPSLAEWRAACASSAQQAAVRRHRVARRRHDVAVGTVAGATIGVGIAHAAGLI